MIVTSDHGESFGADGTTDHDPAGHGTSLYPEQTRVPMFVIAAGKVRPGQEITQVVSTRAIPSMITHLLGLTGTPFHDAYVPEVLRPESEAEGRVPPALMTLNYNQRKVRSVIWDRWQYLRVQNAPDDREELYDLAIDPLATTNQAPVHPVMDPVRRILQQLLTGG